MHQEIKKPHVIIVNSMKTMATDNRNKYARSCVKRIGQCTPEKAENIRRGKKIWGRNSRQQESCKERCKCHPRVMNCVCVGFYME